MTTTTNNPLVKQLVEFGLSDKEAIIYLALLGLEVATVGEIAKSANINRSTTYVVLEMLKKKGLVHISEDKKAQRYVAVSPDFLLKKAEARAKEAEEMKNKINNIVPELKGLYKGLKKKPKVMVFEGKEGLRKVYSDVYLSEPKIKEFRTYEEITNSLKLFPDFLQYDLEYRAKNKVKVYAIHPNKKEIMGIGINEPKGPLVEMVFVPKEKYKFPVDITIYGNRIAFASPTDLFGIIIEHKEIAEAIKNIYDLAFEEGKRFSHKLYGKKLIEAKRKRDGTKSK